MRNDKDQSQCKNDYIKVLINYIKQIDIINSETPWSASEPSWWNEMMISQRHAQDLLKRLKGNKS